MDTLDKVLICDLVQQLDDAVPREGAGVVHGLDEMFEAGCEAAFNVDDRPDNFIPGTANRRGLLRFGIEHLKAGIVERDIPDESWVAEADTAYLSERCWLFGYVRNEKYNYAELKKIQVSEFGKLGSLVMIFGGILIVLAAIIGFGTIVGWVGNKF